jgi:hypothetical protein
MEGVDKAVDTFNVAAEKKVYCILNKLLQVLVLGNKLLRQLTVL